MASNQPHVADFDFDEGGAVGLSVLFLGVRRRNRDLRNTWHFPLPVLLPARRAEASRWVLGKYGATGHRAAAIRRATAHFEAS